MGSPWVADGFLACRRCFQRMGLAVIQGKSLFRTNRTRCKPDARLPSHPRRQGRLKLPGRSPPPIWQQPQGDNPRRSGIDARAIALVTVSGRLAAILKGVMFSKRRSDLTAGPPRALRSKPNCHPAKAQRTSFSPPRPAPLPLPVSTAGPPATTGPEMSLLQCRRVCRLNCAMQRTQGRHGESPAC